MDYYIDITKQFLTETCFLVSHREVVVIISCPSKRSCQSGNALEEIKSRVVNNLVVARKFSVKINRRRSMTCNISDEPPSREEHMG